MCSVHLWSGFERDKPFPPHLSLYGLLSRRAPAERSGRAPEEDAEGPLPKAPPEPGGGPGSSRCGAALRGRARWGGPAPNPAATAWPAPQLGRGTRGAVLQLSCLLFTLSIATS